MKRPRHRFVLGNRELANVNVCGGAYLNRGSKKTQVAVVVVVVVAMNVFIGLNGFVRLSQNEYKPLSSVLHMRKWK